MKTYLTHSNYNKIDRKYYAMPTGRADSPAFDLYSSDATANAYGANMLGQIIDAENGKMFRLALVGASNLVVGNVIQSKAVDTQFTNMAVPAAVVTGATGAITITNGTTVLSGGELKGGSLSVYTTPGLGEEYTIMDNSAATNGGALNVYLDRPIRTAWTTSTKVNARYSPWYNVIQAPATTLTGMPVGVAQYAIPTVNYGYIQTHGVAAALSDGTSILVGSEIASPSGTAGAVTLGVAGLPTIGYALQAAASAHNIGVYLQID